MRILLVYSAKNKQKQHIFNLYRIFFYMKLSIDNRTLEIAEYIVKTHCTVRAASSKFGIAKSTIHKDITNRLPTLNNDLYEKVRMVFDNNFSERHIRGGESTRKMYLEKKHCHNS